VGVQKVSARALDEERVMNKSFDCEIMHFGGASPALEQQSRDAQGKRNSKRTVQMRQNLGEGRPFQPIVEFQQGNSFVSIAPGKDGLGAFKSSDTRIATLVQRGCHTTRAGVLKVLLRFMVLVVDIVPR